MTKQLILILKILCLCSSGLYAGTIKTEGKVGRPSKNCSGIGACEVKTTSSASEMSFTWSYNEGENYITLTWEKADLSNYYPEALEEMTGQKTVLFEDPTTIPAEVIKQLSVPVSKIGPGRFAIKENQKTFVITMPFE